ncbi:unnamed protein product, partial [Pleuronectes platessa]
RRDKQRERETERQTDRQTEQMDRLRERGQRDGELDRLREDLKGTGWRAGLHSDIMGDADSGARGQYLIKGARPQGYQRVLVFTPVDCSSSETLPSALGCKSAGALEEWRSVDETPSIRC